MEDEVKENIGMKGEVASKVGQEQIHGLLFSEKLSWQAIIYDLINTEQLKPWDIDISLLAEKFLLKVRDLEEANFFVSSKVLLAAALMLRMKSEILLNEDIKDLDDVLYGRKQDSNKYVQERIELEEDLPDLVPRTPLPRFRKVSLHELMSALGKAIQTETRRIKRVVVARQHEIEAGVSLPKANINVKDEIRRVNGKLREIFSSREERVAFSEFAGEGKDARVGDFVPLLHLDNQDKVFLEQDGYLSEIYIWTKDLYVRKNKVVLEMMRKEAELAMEEEITSLGKENEKQENEVKRH